MLQFDMFLKIPIQFCAMRAMGALKLGLLATLQFHMVVKGLLPTINFSTVWAYKSLIRKLTVSNISSSNR
jgi:hypothetical protein